MATKYPIVLVHGIATKQLRILNAFGKIGNKIEDATVQTKIKTAENIFFIAHRQRTPKRCPFICMCKWRDCLKFA